MNCLAFEASSVEGGFALNDYFRSNLFILSFSHVHGLALIRLCEVFVAHPGARAILYLFMLHAILMEVFHLLFGSLKS